MDRRFGSCLADPKSPLQDAASPISWRMACCRWCTCLASTSTRDGIGFAERDGRGCALGPFLSTRLRLLNTPTSSPDSASALLSGDGLTDLPKRDLSEMRPRTRCFLDHAEFPHHEIEGK